MKIEKDALIGVIENICTEFHRALLLDQRQQQSDPDHATPP